MSQNEPPTTLFRRITRLAIDNARKLAGLAVAATVTGFIALHFGLFSDRTRYLDYSVTEAPALIRKPNIPNVKLMVGSTVVDDISTVTVIVTNHSDNDFVDVPIRVELIGASPNEAPKVLQGSWQINPEVSETAPMTQPAGTADRVTYRYLMKVVNRGDAPLLTATFTLIGAVVPKVDVSVSAKGLRARLLPTPQSSSQRTLTAFDMVTSGVLACVSTIFALTSLKDMRLRNTTIWRHRVRIWKRAEQYRIEERIERRNKLVRPADPTGEADDATTL